MARRGRVHPILRLTGRVLMTMGLCAVAVFMGIAFTQRIQENFMLDHDLVAAQRDVRSLHVQHAAELREIRRLQNPEGAVPFIYQRLRMVRPGQTLIFLDSPAPSPSPTP